MTQEDKELLLKDLCARLPYGVVINTGDKDVKLDRQHQGIGILYPEDCSDEFNKRNNNASFYIVISGCYYGEKIKPYLRPMSSMTEEEAKELLFVRLASKYGESCAYIKNFIKLNEVSFQKKPPYEGSIAVWFSFENKIYDTPQTREYSKCEYLGQINDISLAEIDWLNAHHFDYRGLIDKSLAVEVTEENNPYKF